MQITLSPMRRDERLTLHREGDVLTLNGEPFDLSGVPEGATLPRKAIDSDWIAGDVERVSGALNVPLILPHGAHAPQDTLFPAPITIDGDGAVALPPHTLSDEGVE